MLLLTACVTSPVAPPDLPPLVWPVLPPPPETISLDGETVTVPLDYWLALYEYIARADAVRAELVREGRIP